jgi:hypothetical protein
MPLPNARAQAQAPELRFGCNNDLRVSQAGQLRGGAAVAWSAELGTGWQNASIAHPTIATTSVNSCP